MLRVHKQISRVRWPESSCIPIANLAAERQRCVKTSTNSLETQAEDLVPHDSHDGFEQLGHPTRKLHHNVQRRHNVTRVSWGLGGTWYGNPEASTKCSCSIPACARVTKQQHSTSSGDVGGHFDLYSVIASDCPPTFVHQRQPSAPMRMQQARIRARTTSGPPFNIKHSVYTTPPHRWPDEPAGSSAPTPPIDGSGIMIAAYRGRCDLPPGFPNLGSYLSSTQCNPRAQPAEASP